MATEQEVGWPHGQALLDEIGSTVPPPGMLALWHLGQSGFAVKSGRTTLYFDPFLKPSGGRTKRTWEPPFDPEQVRDADYVFCSHDHSDHLDPYTLERLMRGSPQAQFIVPPGAVPHMRVIGVPEGRIIAAQVGQRVTLGPLVVQAVPASHGDRAQPLAEYLWEPDPEHGYRFVGFVVDANGVRLYHAGDTVVYPGMIETLQPLAVDLALLPINGRDWFRESRQIIGNLNEREAADLGNTIGAGMIVPMHYDIFAGNPGSPGVFAEYAQSQYPGQDFHIPARCRRWLYTKEVPAGR